MHTPYICIQVREYTVQFFYGSAIAKSLGRDYCDALLGFYVSLVKTAPVSLKTRAK